MLKVLGKMVLKWILFIIISFIIIYNIHLWIDKVIKSRQNTRDLVTSQTSKYKQMLEQLLDKGQSPSSEGQSPCSEGQGPSSEGQGPSSTEEEDLLAFSRSLESEIL
jgi:hypothetical protein